MEFPEDLRRFIRRHIDSLDELESLLLLAREPARDWSAEVLAEALYTSVQAAKTNLVRLKAKGLVESGGESSGPTYRFRASGESAPLVDRLGRMYPTWRVTVTTLIYSKPDPGIEAFKDAFDFRKGRED